VPLPCTYSTRRQSTSSPYLSIDLCAAKAFRKASVKGHTIVISILTFARKTVADRHLKSKCLEKKLRPGSIKVSIH
jgi:hypothetical protein